jgi:transcriptional regulator with XRE-family HTH domain
MGYKSTRASLLKRPAVQAAYDEQRELGKLGRLLRRARETSNLRQQEVASVAGIAQGDISRIEHGLGERGPTFDTLVRLAHAQGMELVLELVPQDKKKREEAEQSQSLREAF